MARPKTERTGITRSLAEDLLEATDFRFHTLVMFVKKISEDRIAKLCESDDALFQNIIAYACNEYGVKKKDLAKLLNVSPAAIGRWEVATAMPPRYGRASIIKTLSTHMQNKIDEALEIKKEAESRGAMVFLFGLSKPDIVEPHEIVEG